MMALMIPIVAILTRHQRTMAELTLRQHSYQPQTQLQVESLASEIRELKQLVHQQAIALDSLTPVTAARAPEHAQQRMG